MNLSDGSAGDVASSSNVEAEDVPLAVPPPPPPPPLPDSAQMGSADGPALPDSIPLPPPPPLPPKPVASNLGLPPPPPGPPPMAPVTGCPPFLVPPSLQQSTMMQPPGTSEGEKERSQPAFLEDSTSKAPAQVIFSV